MKKFLLLSAFLFWSSLYVLSADWYVSLDGTGQGTSWADATNDLQGAIAACPAGYTVWVSNGTYVGNFEVGAITVKGKTGNPADVILDGNAEERTVSMGENVGWLMGLTITNGYNVGEPGGGGVYRGQCSNCVIKLNHSDYGGGGIYYGYAINCTIEQNTCGDQGGGTRGCTLVSCLIVSNSAQYGGGDRGSFINNCTITKNSASTAGGGKYEGSLLNSISWDNNIEDSSISESYSCGVGYTGTGSITNDPLFIGGGDYRLQTNSPCWNTGNNGAYVGITNSVDLAGNKRIWPQGGTVDMGAYEYGSEKDYPSSQAKHIISITDHKIDMLNNTIVLK